MSEKIFDTIYQPGVIFSQFNTIKDNCGNKYNAIKIVRVLNSLREENKCLKNGVKDNKLPYLRDELRGYFGLLNHDTKNLSEKAIVEKIKRDISDILLEVYEE